MRRALVLSLLLAAAACKKARPPEPRAPRPVASKAAPADAELPPDDDPSWLAGTWEKQGEPRWLLFNLPSEVAELAGKPARVVRRGKLVVHGRFISAIFDDGELQLEGTRDHAQLTARGGGVYRRGAPP